MAPLAPQLLLALLLLATSLPTEGSDWDSLSCTGDALTVPRGQLAVMSCAVSTPLSHVAIRLSTPGKASQLIFGVDGPGNFSNSGWRLEVRGGKARLVIPDAQPAQAGEYTWFLVGTHRSVRHTRLSVSELLVTETVSTLPTAPGMRTPQPASVMVSIPVLLIVITPVLICWCRKHSFGKVPRILQVSESTVSRRPVQEEADAAEVAIPMVGPLNQDTDSFGLESKAPGGDSGPQAVRLEEDRWPERLSHGLPGPLGQSTQPHG